MHKVDVKIIAEGQLGSLTPLVHSSTLAFVGGTHSGGVYARIRGRKSWRLGLNQNRIQIRSVIFEDREKNSPMTMNRTVATQCHGARCMGVIKGIAQVFEGEAQLFCSFRQCHRSRLRIVNLPFRTQRRTGIFHPAS